VLFPQVAQAWLAHAIQVTLPSIAPEAPVPVLWHGLALNASGAP
jgi:hypothetical protein